jgi:acyl-CoA reductase-like NAD-dependent aldehyde dehydrogenase
MIDEAAATRLQGWVQRAVDAGATLLCGGGRTGSMLEATLLEGVPAGQPIDEDEAFGPVATLRAFDTFDEALLLVNQSRFGLQAGVFTSDLSRSMRAWDELDVGGVVIGDVPSFRVDNMPYGGVKASGAGREGVRYAIEDMTEARLMIVKTES